MNEALKGMIVTVAVTLAGALTQILLFLVMRSDNLKRKAKETRDYFEIYYPSGLMWLGIICNLVLFAIPLMMAVGGNSSRAIYICLAALSPLYLAGVALMALPFVQVIIVDSEGLIIKSFLKKDVRLNYEDIDYAELRRKGDGEKLFIYKKGQEKHVLMRDNVRLANLDRLDDKFKEHDIRLDCQR